jgi:hypothetical protein
MDLTEMGPQISKCISSKGYLALLQLGIKGSFLCLAKWHTSQVALLSTFTKGNLECKAFILEKER